MENDERNKANSQLDQLLSAVLKSSKYRYICEELITSMGIRELTKQQNLKKAINSTKNKLHQIGGAYFLGQPKYTLWLEWLRRAKNSDNRDVLRKTCAKIMRCHASTRERLNILDQFYVRVFSLLPPIYSIMDIACGFHPLSIPWMPISDKVTYYAYDIYNDLTNFLNDFMRIINIQGRAETRDVIKNPPEINTDLAFILNSIPCLEQIQQSAGLKILESIKAKFLVVSFPIQSLGGKEKGMRKYYNSRFDELTKEKDWVIQRLESNAELVFLITK